MRRICVQAHRHRQPGRGRHAAHPRGPGDERRVAGRGAHHDDRAVHRRRDLGHVRPRGRRGLPAGPGVRAPVPQPRPPGEGAHRGPRRRRVGRLGLRRRGRRLRRPHGRAGHHLHRPQRRRDALPGRQDRLQAARRGGRRPGRPVEQRRRAHPRRGPRGRRAHRLPPHAQGHRGRRRARDPPRRHPRGPDRRLPAHLRRGPPRLRQRRAVPREARHRRPPRRGAAHLRRGYCVGPRRPRLHRAAPQPEDHRGVALAAAHARSGRDGRPQRRAPRPPRRLPGRRDRGVPLPAAAPRVRLPRGEHPPPGRAPDHRGRDRLRPGEGADPHRGRREAAAHAPDRGGPRDRGPPQRRGPRPRLRPRPRPHHPPRPAGGPRHPRRHRFRRGRHHPGRLRLDGRQGHRLRTPPLGRARPPPSRARRDHRRHRGRRDQQELHPRVARAARGHRPRRRRGGVPLVAHPAGP